MIRMKYNNPVLPGFYPDPSICRVGKDYYMVTSSFEYFPGVPIFHSLDLVNWRQIGHCLTRTSQLSIKNIPSSRGIWAPTIRHHNGVFYMVTTDAGGKGHFYVYTEDPAAEWSEPVFVEGKGFDPDLFFDDDGKMYFMEHDLNGKGITQWEIDINSGSLIGNGQCIWKGFEDRYCEAPHLYKIQGKYYLMVAEGGTYRGHMIVVARSDSPTGPFEGCPHNPILSHRCEVLYAIQSTGHGDFVQAEDGSWWIVFLATRPNNRAHHLGRETFLAPVTWTGNGWPIINNNKCIELEMDAACLPQHKWKEEAVRDDFNDKQLKNCWNFRRVPLNEYWSLESRKGWLKLLGTANTLNDIEPYMFIGRRQQHFNCQVSTLMAFNPVELGEEAGLTVIMNEEHHYEVAVVKFAKGKAIIVRKRIGDLVSIVANEPIEDESIVLKITAERNQYILGYLDQAGTFIKLATAMPKYLSSEVAGGFTGVYFGLYATGNGKESTAPAFFDWFDYEKGDVK